MDPFRQVSYQYDNGFLVSVSGYAPELAYHGNGALARVQHANGLTDTLGRDPDWMSRPSGLSTAGSGGDLWSSGTFTYDDAGNILKMGPDEFFYDEVSRLTRAEVHAAGSLTTETFHYDRFGNLTSIGTPGNERTYAISQLTNRLTDPGYTYDTAGNLTSSPSGTYHYDPISMVTQVTGTDKNEQYIYTPEDERLVTLAADQTQPVKWSLRGLDAKVARTYTSGLSSDDGFASFVWTQDYIYRSGSLLASRKPEPSGRAHYSLPPGPPWHSPPEHRLFGPTPRVQNLPPLRRRADDLRCRLGSDALHRPRAGRRPDGARQRPGLYACPVLQPADGEVSEPGSHPG